MRKQVEIVKGEINFDFSLLKDGKYMLILEELYQEKDISYYQKYYGALKNTLYKDGETGYKLSEIHELAKDYIFPILYEDVLTNFETDLGEGWSTKELSLEGWKNFIYQFRIFAQEKFNCNL